MTLILRPIGRGNWKPTRVTIESIHIARGFFMVGQRIELGMGWFRICEILT